MHKSDNGCQVLLERTARALTEEAMQMLLITTQHSNMLLCIKYCVAKWVRVIWWVVLIIKYQLLYRVLLPLVASKWKAISTFSREEQNTLFISAASWFPHTKVKFQLPDDLTFNIMTYHTFVLITFVTGEWYDCDWGVQNGADLCLSVPPCCYLIHRK